MEKTEKKQFKELTDEELKNVTGGLAKEWLVKDTPIALVSSESEFTCPDGRKVSSFSQCSDHAALVVGVQETHAVLKVGVQGTMALVD